MTRRLRGGSGRNGLILANGGVLSYQHAICISSSPRKGMAYPDIETSECTEPEPTPPFVYEAEGPAMIEVSTETSCFTCHTLGSWRCWSH